MRVSMMAVLISMALGIGCSAQAEDCNASQTAMNACAGKELSGLDAELNTQYKAQLGYLKSPARKEAFKQAQRKWIAFRDADCLYQVGKAAEGGSMWSMAQAQCLTEHTRVRVEQLKAYSACRDEGCPK
jgi:uncharacterized protein YecT (DUF1311 family)